MSAVEDNETSNEISYYPESVYLNFTSMHGVRTIVSRIRYLASHILPASRVPPASYFRQVAEIENPVNDLECRELPFYTYLITGNAGSGKSTCLQTLSETVDCVITGTTKVAAQNVYSKLSTAYSSPHINTIFQEFGFRSNHVQATLGKWQYIFQSTPPSIAELQKKDIVYYWEVILDITKTKINAMDIETVRGKFKAIRTTEKLLKLPSGSLDNYAFFAHSGLPAFARTNIIVIDEAGLLGRYVLTAVVYSWWLVNAIYRTPLYERRLAPVIVCVGSPTQTGSLESTFEHSRLKCSVRTSENVLTYMICNKTLRDYLDLPNNWAIFINNKRCTEPEFGDLMKCLEYGLPITDAHARMADSFVVPESFINNPANLPGWTRLYSSHKEVSAYMSRLHAYLKISGDNRFTVFSLPSYTLVRLNDFNEYRKTANQPSLTIERWLSANSSRLSNWSQSRDQDTVTSRCYVRSDCGLAVSCSDVTYVLNSQVAVTTRLRKWMFGFCGTFKAFMSVLKDDSFIKTHGDGTVEYAYKFLSNIIFNGLINFYDFLLDRTLPQKDVDSAYARLAEVTNSFLPNINKYDIVYEDSQTVCTPPNTNAVTNGEQSLNDEIFNFSTVGCNNADESKPDEDVLFSALTNNTIDLFYCHYDFGHPETPSEIHAQFALLKGLFIARYSVLSEIFGHKFFESRFHSYIENVTFKKGEMFAHSLRGGMLSLALQTDSYTLVGYTGTKIPAFSDTTIRKRLGENIFDILQELNMPLMVLKDQKGFMSILNVNINEFIDTVDDKELKMAVTVDYGLSSKLSMTIARSQGLSLDKVAICFPKTGLRISSVYVAMSRVVSSEFLRMNINPLRENFILDNNISEYILSALRNAKVHVVY